MWQRLDAPLLVTSPPISSLRAGWGKVGRQRAGVTWRSPPLLVPVAGAVGAWHVVALRSSPCRSVLLANLPKPCGELTWCYTLHLFPEHTLVKFSHIPPQSVPLKRSPWLDYISRLMSEVFKVVILQILQYTWKIGQNKQKGEQPLPGTDTHISSCRPLPCTLLRIYMTIHHTLLRRIPLHLTLRKK